MWKLKRLRQTIKVWNKEVFGDVNRQVDYQLERVQQIQADIESEGFTEELRERELEAQRKLSRTLLMQSNFLQQKARSAWLKDGDRNTAFFHHCCQIRNGRSGIQGLMVDGTYTEDPMALGNHIISFYTSFLRIKGVALWTIDQVISPIVRASDNAGLTVIPSNSEIKEVVFDMGSDSSPGPDGFNGVFYRHFWDVISANVSDAVRFFFTSSSLPTRLNDSFMALILKTKDANSIENFRPIVMSNFLFKIISKILATRSGKFIYAYLSPTQFGFILGRQIHDCIAMVFEGFNVLHGRTDTNMILKIDIRKAFDTLKWGFLLHVLRHFGFSEIFIHWVDVILRSSRISVLLNGTPVNPKLTHLLFGYDIVILCATTIANARQIFELLEVYANISGQVFNPANYMVFFGSRVFSHIWNCIQGIMGISLGSLSTSYLGVPIFNGAPKQAVLQPLYEKILMKFKRWKGSSLSIARRICLVNSVITSFFVHSMAVFF
ncbi:hypothetical protein DH2020_020143 [Rehmannia glutinosa]|uniref:Reverse transcriptase domain-containing protein n=1 Tax=Rehmannia glutinosa TaxID=99300 RepID=A0ABR0WGT3_REHGL